MTPTASAFANKGGDLALLDVDRSSLDPWKAKSNIAESRSFGVPDSLQSRPSRQKQIKRKKLPAPALSTTELPGLNSEKVRSYQAAFEVMNRLHELSTRLLEATGLGEILEAPIALPTLVRGAAFMLLP